MRWRQRLAIALATAIMVVFGFGIPGSISQAKASPSPVPSGQSCIVRDSDGQVTWFGDASPDMNKMGEDLAAVVADYPDNATGTAFCSHYEGLAVYLSDPTPELTASIKAIGAAHPDAIIETHVVPHSLNDLMSTGRTLVSALGLGMTWSVGGR